VGQQRTGSEGGGFEAAGKGTLDEFFLGANKCLVTDSYHKQRMKGDELRVGGKGRQVRWDMVMLARIRSWSWEERPSWN
jgi:hypothetical protein